MSDSYMKDRARLHLVHKFSWLSLALGIAGAAALSAIWGEGHLPNVLAYWWANFAVWAGAPKLPAIISGTRFESLAILAAMASEPGHHFWAAIISHSRQLMAWLVASPILSATILFSFQSWKKSKSDEVEIKRGAEILDAKELSKRIKKGE